MAIAPIDLVGSASYPTPAAADSTASPLASVSMRVSPRFSVGLIQHIPASLDALPLFKCNYVRIVMPWDEAYMRGRRVPVLQRILDN